MKDGMTEKNFSVVYIVGASRSGSTFIEDYVARYLGGVSCGELYRIADFYQEKESTLRYSSVRPGCSCGVRVRECAFWNDVSCAAGIDLSSSAMRSQLGRFQRAMFRLSVMVGGKPLTGILSKVIPAFRRELEAGKNCFRIYNAISQITKTPVILDSSKQAHQYYILKAISPTAMKVIALVRDRRAVVTSMTRGRRAETFYARLAKRRKRFRHPTREAVVREAMRAWITSTLNGLIAYTVTRSGNRLLLRYEDFCASPEVQLNRIAHRFAFKVGILSDDFREPHAIGGSPSRHEVGFEKVDVTSAKEWRDALDSNGASTILAKCLNRLLGYEKGAD